MKLMIKAAVVLTIAVVLCPFICKAKSAWTGAQPRIQQEQVRAQNTIQDVKDGAKEVTRVFKTVTEGVNQ